MGYSKVMFKFVYPNKDEIECDVFDGDSLYSVALANGIQMDDKVKQSCLIQIQGVSNLYEPNEIEVADLNQDQLANGFRYAYTYKVSPHLNGALIFLNLVRVTYRDRHDVDHHMHAVLNENLMDLRDRRSDVIDLSFACHGALACSTCHCIFDSTDATFGLLGEISNDEEDLLYYCNPQDYSRLGCQVTLKPEIDKIRFRHPKSIGY